MKKFLIAGLLGLMALAASVPAAQGQITHKIPMKVYPVSSHQIAVGDSSGTYLEIAPVAQFIGPQVLPGQPNQVQWVANGKKYNVLRQNFRQGDGTVWGSSAIAAVRAFGTVTPTTEEITSTKTYAANTYRYIRLVITTGTATIQTGSDAAAATQPANFTQEFTGGLLGKSLTITPQASSKVTVTYYK
jgi:hypothetical protein